MNAQQFLTWMRSVRTPSENPGQTSREESAQLDALLDSFPYFQSGHLLYIKNLHNQGSFLYNNQLKTAAAYAVNRKVLYNLITLKQTEDENSAQSSFGYAQDDKKQPTSFDSTSTTLSTDAQDDTKLTGHDTKPVIEANEEVSAPLVFPPKKFTKDPDEWEAGMLRQLQLLHHWQNQSAVEQSDRLQSNSLQSGSQQSGSQQSAVNQSAVNQSGSQQSAVEQSASLDSTSGTLSTGAQDDTAAKTESERSEQRKVPDAKEEINTLLYVLVEPGQPEDLSEENVEDISLEPVAEESETTQWEIKTADEVKSESETPIAVPNDPVQKEIMVEAIHSTFELEVDDTIPSVDELKPFRLDPIEETPVPVTEEKPAEEVVVTGMEMSFSQWLQEVNKAEVDKSKFGKSGSQQPSSFDSTSTTLNTGAQDDKKQSSSQQSSSQQSGSQQSSSQQSGSLQSSSQQSGSLQSGSLQSSSFDSTSTTLSTGAQDDKKPELPKTPLSSDVLVNQFIKDEPRINVKKSGFFNPVNMAKKSVQESDEFLTETLARIYAKQGNTVKAIRAYQKLSLKFPEKTAYFAALIEELKRTPNK